MKNIVTGVAGFIGSSLAERLVRDGQEVTGIDCFIDYYPREIKERNLTWLKKQPGFSFIKSNILGADLRGIISEGDVIFHQAAQAGVRSSWGKDFAIYTENNIRATQMLLEVCKEKKIGRLVYASSSSIYGDAESLPTRENMLPKPVSPYGVSKLAAEHLCQLYWRNFEVPSTCLRYFTVYGPRQRPDMAFNRLIRFALTGDTFEMYGNGEQSRDFTYIDDIVAANIGAAKMEGPVQVLNIGGGSRVTLNEAVGIIEEATGKKISIDRKDVQLGDVKHTAADTSLAASTIGYKPLVDIKTGLANQVEFQKSILQDMK